MDYTKLFKRAFELIWKHKFLWFLGFLSGGFASGASNIGNLTGSDLDKIKNWQPSIPSDTPTNLVKASTGEIGKVLGETVSNNISAGMFWTIIAVFVLLVLVGIYLSTVANGSLIKATYDLNKGNESNLRTSWKYGHRLFWRQLSLNLLIFAIAMAIIFVAVLPPALLGIFGLTIPAVLIGIITIIAGLLALFYTALVSPYAARTLVLERKRPVEAIKYGVTFFNMHWKKLILLYFLEIGLSIAVMIVMMVAGISAALVAITPVIILFAASVSLWGLAIAYMVFVVIVAVIIAGVLHGIMGAFFSAIPTLAYTEIHDKR